MTSFRSATCRRLSLRSDKLVELEHIAVGVTNEAGDAPAPVDRPLGDRDLLTLRPVEQRVEPLDDECGVCIAWKLECVVEQRVTRVWLSNPVEDEVDAGS